MENETRIYGVSSGNGNNGVSHMFADYYVKTNNPWYLARLAILSEFKPGEGQAWAQENVVIDGESAYTISATIYDPPREDTEEESEDEDSGSYCDVNGAWLIVEVFPETESELCSGKMVYDSIEEAFSEDLLKAFPDKE
jgi:hypothetical protein